MNKAVRFGKPDTFQYMLSKTKKRYLSTNEAAQVSEISKYGGGIGLHVSNIRSKGSIIRGTNGPSSGIIPMLQVYNNIARYVNQCFSGETKIYTDKGLIEFKYIKIGDKVLTNDGSFKKVKYVYNDRYSIEKHSLFSLSINMNGFNSTIVTKGHPLYIIKNPDNLNFDTISNKIDRNQIEHIWCDVENLTTNDLICFPIPKHEEDVNIYDENDCYFYGLLLTKCVIDNENNTVSIRVDESDKITFIRNYLSLLNFDFSEKEYTLNNCLAKKEDNVVDIKFEWDICHQMKFKYNQIYNNNDNIIIDPLFLNLPIEKSKYIVKAIIEYYCYFDKDICIEDGFICFQTYDRLKTQEKSMENIINGLQYLLLRMGILTKRDDMDLYIPIVESLCELLNITSDMPGYFPKSMNYIKKNDYIYTKLDHICERDNIQNTKCSYVKDKSSLIQNSGDMILYDLVSTLQTYRLRQ